MTVKAEESSEITITLANSDGKTTTLKTTKKTWSELTGTEFTIESVPYQITNDEEDDYVNVRRGSVSGAACTVRKGGQTGNRVKKTDQIINGSTYSVAVLY